MVRRATCMNLQEHLQAMQSPSPANKLKSQGRESSLPAPNTPRHTMTPLVRFIVFSVGTQTGTSFTKTVTIHRIAAR